MTAAMRDKLIAMLELQDQMNSRVHPDWRSQNYPWYRAIWTESAELMDHYGWKWWKKQSPDREQVALELIDIWHFGLSQYLQECDDVEGIARRLEVDLTGQLITTDFREAVEMFAASVLTRKAFDAAGFVCLMQGVGLQFEELYRSYIGKNVLNLFRQDNGYKEGHYRKVWKGREDNEHLVLILQSLESDRSDFRDSIYRALAESYSVG